MTSLDHGSGGPSVFEAMRSQIEHTAMPAAQRDRSPLRLRPLGSHWRALSAAATATLAALLVAVLLVFDATDSPPAFAVTRGDHGLVTISLSQIRARGALNARLQAMEVRVRVVPITRRCVAPVRAVVTDGRAIPAATLRVRTLSLSAQSHGRPQAGKLMAVTVAPPIRRDRTLVLAVTPNGKGSAAQLVQGVVPACARATGSPPPVAPVR